MAVFPGSAWPALSPVAYVTKQTQLTRHMLGASLEGPVPPHSLESFMLGTGLHGHSGAFESRKVGGGTGHRTAHEVVS